MSSDPRPTIGRGALEVLFNILRDHGQLFSKPFWMSVFKSVIFPIFDSAIPEDPGDETWTSGVQPVAAKCLVDLFIDYYDMVGLLLREVVLVLAKLMRTPDQSTAGVGVASLLHLTSSLQGRLTEEEWGEIVAALKEVVAAVLTEFSKTMWMMEKMEIPEFAQIGSDGDVYSEQEYFESEVDDDVMEAASYGVVRMKSHISILLLLAKVLSLSIFLPSFSCTEALQVDQIQYSLLPFLSLYCV